VNSRARHDDLRSAQPSLTKTVSERFGHSQARLHPASFRQLVEMDPFVDAPSTLAKLPRDLAYLHASGSHLMDRLKQLQFLLLSLPGNFHLLHRDAGSKRLF
jgi:hypothetical protein